MLRQRRRPTRRHRCWVLLLLLLPRLLRWLRTHAAPAA
jgi:hypothetical protein